MHDKILYYIWVIVQILIGYNLVLPIALLLVYQFTRLFRAKKVSSPTAEADYAIIVTAFEQTSLLNSVVDSILKLNYKNYLIYIVADKCDISGLRFDSDRVILLRPETTLASNTRSHFYAIERFQRAHERLTIIDSDNLVDPQYLNELNIFFERGFLAVQGIREAKNLNTTFACLDAARDIYYHYFDGKVLFGLGSSATLAGSGMAFTTTLYKECLGNLDIVGAGFDKVLQYQILKRNLRIAFAEKAIVYDEKTSASDQLVNQRSRWINTWLKYFGFGFKVLGQGIVNFSRNQLIFGLILLRPPLFMFLVLSMLFMLISIFTNPLIALIWLSAFICFIVAFAYSLIVSDTDQRIYDSLMNIPKFMFYQIISLTKAKNANKRSVATRHLHDANLGEIKQNNGKR